MKMKQSIFNQELEVKGVLKTVKGSIKVQMNYAKESFVYNNPSTHEQENKERFVHKIEGYIDGTIFWKNVEIRSENMLLSEVGRCKEQLLVEMHNRANKEKDKSLVDKMKELGFN